MSEKTCTLCSLTEPIHPKDIYRRFHAEMDAAKTKQQMLDACRGFISGHGGFSGRADLLTKIKGNP